MRCQHSLLSSPRKRGHPVDTDRAVALRRRNKRSAILGDARWRRTVSHDRRELSDKESQRWIATALAAKPLLTGATMVTSLGDRESDIFAAYASVPDERFHVIARSMHDRKLADGTWLYAASDHMAVMGQDWIVLPARAQRSERPAHLELRFATLRLARPQTKLLRHLPDSLPMTLVDVRELNSPAGTEPLHCGC